MASRIKNAGMSGLAVASALTLIGTTSLLAAQQPDGEAQVAEIVARLPQAVGNVTFTPDGRIVFSHHPFFEPETRVAELNASGTDFRPFPNADWNTPKPDTDAYLDSVLGVRGDETGVIWMLDMGQRTNITPKIGGWNTRTNRLERVYRIPSPASIDVSQVGRRRLPRAGWPMTPPAGAPTAVGCTMTRRRHAAARS